MYFLSTNEDTSTKKEISQKVISLKSSFEYESRCMLFLQYNTYLVYQIDDLRIGMGLVNQNGGGTL